MRSWTFPVGPLACNCSILTDETSREALVIDPGGHIDEILALLRENELRLKAILVTHAHIDHIAGAAELKKLTGAPVLLNRHDAELYGQIEWQARWLNMRPPEQTAIDASLEQGQRLHCGSLELQVLETPGHTQGSVCLYLPTEARLYAGDTLFAGTIGRTDLPGGDSAQILSSIHDKLLVLPDDTEVIPGHGSATTIGRERQHNPYLS